MDSLVDESAMNTTPIGIIDSGFGGLSIYQSIVSLLPNESTVYVGDQAHAPYGNKTSEYIQDRIKKIITFLLTKHVKLIVIACNTATVSGIDLYRQWFPKIPIIGVVPVVKTAAEITKKKEFAVLSTDATSNSEYQKALISRLASGCHVYNLSCSDLVQLVEEGKMHSPGTRTELEKILTPDLLRAIDVIVLGCTHFPFLRSTIHDIVGGDVSILDSGAAVARQVRRILERNSILSDHEKPSYSFYSTRHKETLSKIASILLEKSTEVVYANI